jgi:predicted TIM-barrel fold metal-dependent hydrolase
MMPDMTVAGACDCHVHVVGSRAQFPQAAHRTYTADLAPLESLRAAAEPLGVTRYVIVQPSFYGIDNACVFGALAALGHRGRGVIAADPESLTPARLEDFERRGACGVRINQYSAARRIDLAGLPDRLERTLETLPRSGWHLEVIAPLSLLVSAERVLRSSTVPIVLDHYGLPGMETTDTSLGRFLLDLLSLPHVWVKLSAPYRSLPDPLATQPPAAWLAAFLRVAPDRCLWGSDWPHTPLPRDQSGTDNVVPYRKIEYRRTLEGFCKALPDAAAAHRILRANPLRLYGFRPDE